MSFKPSFRALALCCWMALAVVPFLSRIHYVPLPQFWGEINVVWLTVGAGLALLCCGDTFARIPRAAWWMLALAALWAAQGLWVPLHFPGLNLVTALAFATLALLAVFTLRLRELWGEDALLDWLAWALLVGALLQSLIGLAQVTGLVEMMGGLLFYDSAHVTTNVFGHIGQRNQYAHYLSWGVVAAAFLHARGRLPRAWAVALLLWLAVSIGWAASRTVLLYCVAVAGLASLWHWRERSEASRRLWLSMLVAVAAVVAMQFLLPLINHALSLMAADSGVERLAASSDGMGSRRVAEWTKAWMVFREHPWFGVGWSQFAAESVRLQMLPRFADAAYNSGLFTNAHNLVLQLLAETGILGAGLAVAGFVWAIWPYFRAPASSAHVLPLSVLAVTVIHSMVEYPLWYLYFLAVLVIMAALAPQAGTRLLGPLRALPLAGLLALGLLSATSTQRFWEMVSLYSPSSVETRAQQQEARLREIIRDEPLFAFHALSTLQERLKTRPPQLEEKLAWVSRLAAFRPYPDVMLQKAQLQALLGDTDGARVTLRLSLASFPTYASDFLGALDASEPRWAGLREEAQRAYDELPEAYR